ncbi:MAG: CD1871A family CXXC motif-containing protein [Christensenellales bacterium]
MPERRRVWLWICLLGLLLMAAGVALGEPGVVLRKAIRICLECIGIG